MEETPPTLNIVDVFNYSLKQINDLLKDDEKGKTIPENQIIDRYIQACVKLYYSLDDFSKLIIFLDEKKDTNNYGHHFYDYLVSEHVENFTQVRDFVKKALHHLQLCNLNMFDDELDPIDEISKKGIKDDKDIGKNDKGFCYSIKELYKTNEEALKLLNNNTKILEEIGQAVEDKLNTVDLSKDNQVKTELNTIISDIIENNTNILPNIKILLYKKLLPLTSLIFIGWGIYHYVTNPSNISSTSQNIIQLNPIVSNQTGYNQTGYNQTVYITPENAPNYSNALVTTNFQPTDTFDYGE